jgi:hypothetical protein
MPWAGHQASGRATKVPCSSYSDGLNSGMGSPDLASRSLRSPSAADLIPSAISVSASRNSIDPLAGPAPSSVARLLMAHLSRCTASATTARTSRGLVIPRTASATARAGIAYRTGPASQIRAGIRDVRCSRTKFVSRRCRVEGTSTSTNSVSSVRMWWLRSAADPVMTLPGPAYSSAAISCCKVVGAPVAAMYTPGSNPRHGPPGRSRCRSALSVTPAASAWRREITSSCWMRSRSRASWSSRVVRAMAA